MNQMRRNEIRNQRGMSLAEVMVASAIFLIILVASLMIYDQSNRIFKTSVESADLQQNTRAGFDRLIADVRMAGFDADRDGVPARSPAGPWQAGTMYSVGAVVSPVVPNGYSYRAVTGGVSGAVEPSPWPQNPGATFTGDGSVTWLTLGPVYQQPDEQIEYAGRSAITIRGNLDYNDLITNAHHGRETDYEPAGGQFPIVTTGNDEIVTYALRSVNGPNPDTLEFWADISKPRSVYPGPGGTAETLVEIPNVDLCTAGCQNPPYTLMRFVLNDDGEIEETAVANNVRNLEFFYYQDLGGRTLVTTLANAVIPGGHGAIGGDGQYNPTNVGGTTNWEHRAIRGRIQTVRVNLVGMNDQPDRNYTNTTETVAGLENYRTYSLESLVTPRNLGLSGLAEPDTRPPGPPTVTSVCVGACKVTRVRWNPPLTGNVDSYEVRWDTALNGAYNNVGVVVPGDVVSAPVLNLAPGVEVFFRVVAINENGSARSENALSRTPVNSTKPGPIANLAVTNGTTAQQNMITLTWTAPTNNDTSLANMSCSGLTQSGAQIDPAEPIRFRVWRGTTADFNPVTNPTSAEIVLDSGVTPQPAGPAGSTITWIDDVSNARTKPPANCKPYWYRVQVYDTCSLVGPAPLEPANANSPAEAATGQSIIEPRADANGLLPAVEGGATSTVPPAAPSVVEIEYDNNASACSRGQNSCTVRLEWPAVTADTSNPTAPITVDQYRVTRERKKASDQNFLPDTVLPVLVDASSNPANQEGTKVIYVDTPPDHDVNDRRKWYYRYTVTALQCGASSVASPPVLFPKTCGLSQSAVVESGASAGVGTAASPWVMGANDYIQVTPPSGVELNRVEFEVYPEPDTTRSNAPIDRHVAGAPPYIYYWENQTDSQVYRIVITMQNTAGCTEQTERFIQDDPVNCPSATVTQTGASGGLGIVTQPWLFTEGDTVAVNQPVGATIASVTFVLVNDTTGTAVGVPQIDAIAPFAFVWPATGVVDNQRYRLTMTLTYLGGGCDEEFVRYITDEPPPVCTGATMTATGATSGAGTLTSPWLVNGGDVLTLVPPTNGNINQVVFTITDNTTNAQVAVVTDSASPFTYTWSDQTDNTVYRVDAAVTYSSTECSVERVTTYVRDQICAGATLTAVGSAGAGTGLTTSSPWVMNANDTVTVAPPSGQTIESVTFTLFNEPGTTALGTTTDSTSPFVYTWSDRVDNSLYRLEATITYTAGCTETIRRYIRDQGTCFITATGGTIVNSRSGNDAIATITYEITNPTSEALTVTGLQVGWTRDGAHPVAVLEEITLTGATTTTVTVPAASGAPPTTGLLTVTGAPTIPASSSSYRVTLRYNIGRRNDVTELTTNWINSLCLRYSAPSFGASTASCNLIGSTTGNPTSCN